MSILTSIKEVFKIIGWVRTGYNFIASKLKKTGTFLQSYTQDIEEEAKGETLDPNNAAGQHYLNQYRLFNMLSPLAQQRIRKFVDFISSPTVTRLIGVAMAGLMFMSPLGPVVAGIAVAFTLITTVASFVAQSARIMKLDRLKTAFQQLETIKAFDGFLQEKIAMDPKMKDMLQKLYQDNVMGPARGPGGVKATHMGTTTPERTLIGTMESVTPLISGLLSFNIPAVIVAGLSYMTSNASRQGRAQGAAENYKCMMENINDNATKLGLKVAPDNESLASLHEAHLRQKAFADALSQMKQKEVSDSMYVTEFNKIFDKSLEEHRRHDPAPSISLWQAMKSNFITGFSAHKGLQHQVALPKDITVPKVNLPNIPNVTPPVPTKTQSKEQSKSRHHHSDKVQAKRQLEKQSEIEF